MRGLAIAGALAVLGSALVGAWPAPGPQSAAADTDPRTAVFCSGSGDSCDYLMLRRNKVVVQHTYADIQRGPTRVCVRAPGGKRLCKKTRWRPSPRGISIARATFPARPGVWSLRLGNESLRLRVPAG